MLYLQNAINYENPKLSKTQRLELEINRGHPLTWRRYHRYADILRFLEYISLKYPDIVELIPLGRSFEGLPILLAKVEILFHKLEYNVYKELKHILKYRFPYQRTTLNNQIQTERSGN